jgi:hypothetical protein
MTGWRADRAREERAVSDEVGEAAGLLWEQAQRQLLQQNADLDTLRTRAVAMLSVAALVAGLFGSRLPRDHVSARTLTAVTLALCLFAGSVVLALAVAAPKKKWLFTFKLDKLLDLVREGQATPMDATYNLARWAEDARQLNAAKQQRMYAMFGWVCVLVGLQVVAWAVAVV